MFETSTAALARQMLAMLDDPPVFFVNFLVWLGDQEHTFADRQSRFDTVGNPRPRFRLDHQSINHNLDRDSLTTRRNGNVINILCLAIDANPHVTATLDVVEQLFVALCRVRLDRSQQHQPSAGFVSKNLVDDVVASLSSDRHITIGAMRLTQASHQNPQVVIDLRHSSNGTTWRRAEVLLLDRDRRRQSFNLIDPRLLQLIHELPRVTGQAFDVPALAFRIDRAHGQRAFPAT